MPSSCPSLLCHSWPLPGRSLINRSTTVSSRRGLVTKPCEAAAQSATYGALTRALIRITRRVLRSSSASRPHQRWRNQACLGQIPAAAVAGIYQDHCAARQFRLVLDNAAKLGEGPSIENHTLLVPSPDPSANALGLEILPGKGTADAFGLRTDLLKTAMVHIRGQMHDAHIASGNARGGHRSPLWCLASWPPDRSFRAAESDPSHPAATTAAPLGAPRRTREASRGP